MPIGHALRRRLWLNCGEILACEPLTVMLDVSQMLPRRIQVWVARRNRDARSRERRPEVLPAIEPGLILSLPRTKFWLHKNIYCFKQNTRLGSPRWSSSEERSDVDC